MQLAVEHVEAEEAHVRLSDRRGPPRLGRMAVSYDGAVAGASVATAQPLLLGAAAASGHIPPGRLTDSHCLRSCSRSVSTRLLAAA